MKSAYGWNRDFGARRDWLDGRLAAGGLTAGGWHGARAALGLIPDRDAWCRLIFRALAAAGFGLLAAALIFAVAFNWNALGHFSRFALVEAAVAAFALVAWWRGTATAAGEAALFAACLATGALLALFGQTYQTGADPWSLFFVWALLILPWLLAGRRASLWLLWVLVGNTALMLYCAQVLGESAWLRVFGLFEWGSVLTLLFNTALLAVFERFRGLGTDGLMRALPRLLALLVLGAVAGILIPMIGWRSEHGGALRASLLAAAACAAFAWLAYRALAVHRDIVVLAAAALCAIGVGFALLIRAVPHADAFGFFLFGAMYWVAAVSVAVLWLRGLGATNVEGEAA
jgi:uncharacterized membrane protein